MIILDDVLPSTVFNRLVTLTVENPNFKWGVCRTATPMDDARSFFAESQPNSWEFDYFSVPLMAAMNRVQMRNSAWEKINLKEVLRIRFGLLTRDIKQIVNTPHVDSHIQQHFVGLYYLNDTDGATRIWKQKLKDWNQDPVFYSVDECELLEEVEPKANRMVIFDGSHYHSSVTPTKTQLRYVINYNFDVVGE